MLEVATSQDGKAGLYLSSLLRPRCCILPLLVWGWISGRAGGALGSVHLSAAHWQPGKAAIFPISSVGGNNLGKYLCPFSL